MSRTNGLRELPESTRTRGTHAAQKIDVALEELAAGLRRIARSEPQMQEARELRAIALEALERASAWIELPAP